MVWPTRGQWEQSNLFLRCLTFDRLWRRCSDYQSNDGRERGESSNRPLLYFLKNQGKARLKVDSGSINNSMLKHVKKTHWVPWENLWDIWFEGILSYLLFCVFISTTTVHPRWYLLNTSIRVLNLVKYILAESWFWAKVARVLLS